MTSACLLFLLYFSHPLCSSSSTFPYLLSPFFFLNFIVFDLFWAICLITSITSEVGSILDPHIQCRPLSLYGSWQDFVLFGRRQTDGFITSGPTNDNIIRRLVSRTRRITLFSQCRQEQLTLSSFMHNDRMHTAILNVLIFHEVSKRTVQYQKSNLQCS